MPEGETASCPRSFHPCRTETPPGRSPLLHSGRANPSFAATLQSPEHNAQTDAGQQPLLTGLNTARALCRKQGARSRDATSSRGPQARRPIPPRSSPRASIAAEDRDRNKASSDYASGTSSVTRSPLHSLSSTIEASRIGTSRSPRRSTVRKWPGAGERVSSVRSS